MFKSSMNGRMRNLLILLVVTLVTLALVACAPTQPAAPQEEAASSEAAAETSSSEEGGDADGTDIRVAWWGSTQRIAKTNAVIDLFEEANPDIQVERESRDWLPYWDKLNIESAANNQPCGIQMQSRFLQQFAPTGALRPLDDLVEAGDIDLSGVAESYIQSGRGDDGQ